MKYNGLIFYQSLILFASYRYAFGTVRPTDYDLRLQLVSLNDHDERSWESVFLSKRRHSDEFIFSNEELNNVCGGAFSSSDIEIVEVFGRVVRISLIRETNQTYVNLLFTEEKSVQQFFREIRSRQTTGYGVETSVDKLFQYRTYDDSPNNEERLEKLEEYAVCFLKWTHALISIDEETFNMPNSGQRTVNITKHGTCISPQSAVHLVLLSKTYNISERIGSNIYVLCSLNIVTHKFILLFRNRHYATNFYKRVLYHRDPQLPCPTDWLTPDIIEKVKSL